MYAPRTGQSFPPSTRLHHPAQFAPALKGWRLGRSDWLVLTVPRTTTSVQPRMGMVIAKRYAKLAVTRNAIKRVLRETFRQQHLTLPPRDYVFRLHCHIAPQSLTQIKQHARSQAEALLQQARGRL